MNSIEHPHFVKYVQYKSPISQGRGASELVLNNQEHIETTNTY